MKKNQGISLISLIITIIVIIILAAIVIFQGFSSLNSAQLSTFTQNCDNVYMATTNRHAQLVEKYALSSDTKNDEQIYAEIALGAPDGISQYSGMDAKNDAVKAGSETTGIESGDNCQRIVESKTQDTLKLSLAKIRNDNTAWYITEDGQVFNASGFVYKDSDNQTRTYFNAKVYVTGEVPALKASGAHDDMGARAIEIAKRIMNGATDEIGKVSGSSITWNN